MAARASPNLLLLSLLPPCGTSLTPELQETTRTCLTKWVLQFLTQRRPIDCNRRELFLPAEAFALLVSEHYVLRVLVLRRLQC